MKGSMFITHKSGLKIEISWLARVVGVVWAGLIYKGVGCGLLHAANLNKPHQCTNTIFSFQMKYSQTVNWREEKESGLSVRHMSRMAQLHMYVSKWEEVSLSDAQWADLAWGWRENAGQDDRSVIQGNKRKPRKCHFLLPTSTHTTGGLDSWLLSTAKWPPQ